MKFNTILMLLVTGILLAGCGDDNATDDTDQGDTVNNSTNTDQPVNTNPVVSPDGTIIPDGGRLLASQCFQCHGTDGHSQTGIDSLAGESERELIGEMLEMRRDNDNDIMTYQAHGYTDAEVRALSAYIAAVSGSSDGNDSYGDDD